MSNDPEWRWVRTCGDPGPVGQPRRYLQARSDPVRLESGGTILQGVVVYRDQPRQGGGTTPYDVVVTIGVVRGEVTPTSITFERRPDGPPLTATGMQRATIGRFVTDAIAFLMGANLEAAVQRHYAKGAISDDVFAELDDYEALLQAIDPAEFEHVPEGMTAPEYLDSLKASIRRSRRRERLARSTALYVAETPPPREIDHEERSLIVVEAYQSAPDGRRHEAVRQALARGGFAHSAGSVKKAITEARQSDYLSPAKSTRPL